MPDQQTRHETVDIFYTQHGKSKIYYSLTIDLTVIFKDGTYIAIQ